MKTKNLFLAVISLLVFGCSDNGDLSEDEDIALSSCELKTTFIREFETEAIILKSVPEGGFFSPFIKFGDEGRVYLIQNYAENRCTIGRICNIPQYAQDWDVPEEGLPVILKGKSYVYDGIQSMSADQIWYDLELSMIKKKLP
ncbi:MAG: hypothetical protein LBJ72_12110 [Dysgonamonadaceae bacterium]|jgi:hypothetical protein|nr:hypothetical protein [Dysgonamonadaceae bacterium]